MSVQQEIEKLTVEVIKFSEAMQQVVIQKAQQGWYKPEYISEDDLEFEIYNKSMYMYEYSDKKEMTDFLDIAIYCMFRYARERRKQDANSISQAI